MKAIPALLISALLAACDLFGVVDCTTDLRPGILLSVSDSLTGEGVTPARATAATDDGSFTDMVTAPEYGGPYPLAYEHAGNYGVEVVASGYVRWVRSGIHVDKDECHVRTVQLDARLTPETHGSD